MDEEAAELLYVLTVTDRLLTAMTRILMYGELVQRGWVLTEARTLVMIEKSFRVKCWACRDRCGCIPFG